MHLVARETLPEPNSYGEDLFCLCRNQQVAFLSPNISAALVCRSKEQRENHREQLLSPLVKQRNQPCTLSSHTHIYSVHSCPSSCQLWIWNKSQEVCWGGLTCFSWTLVQIWDFFCASIITFCPQTFTLFRLLSAGWRAVSLSERDPGTLCWRICGLLLFPASHMDFLEL